IRQRVQRRGTDVSAAFDRLAALDATRRDLLPRVEQLKAERNRDGEAIAQAKRRGEDASALLEASSTRAEAIKRLDAELGTVEDERRALLLTLPNAPHPSVPEGRDATGNVEVRRAGDPPSFDFTPLAHWDLGPAL